MPQQTATRTDAAKKKMKQERKYQITGIAIALALHIGAGVAMYYSYLSSLAAEEQPLPSAKSEITFGGEYVQLGDLPLPDLDDGIASEALSTEETTTTQADNATGDGEALVSSNADSPLAAPSQDGGDVARRQAELRKEKPTSTIEPAAHSTAEATGKAKAARRTEMPRLEHCKARPDTTSAKTTICKYNAPHVPKAAHCASA